MLEWCPLAPIWRELVQLMYNVRLILKFQIYVNFGFFHLVCRDRAASALNAILVKCKNAKKHLISDRQLYDKQLYETIRIAISLTFECKMMLHAMFNSHLTLLRFTFGLRASKANRFQAFVYQTELHTSNLPPFLASFAGPGARPNLMEARPSLLQSDRRRNRLLPSSTA